LLQINSTRFGTLEVPNDKIITMPGGMPGFPGDKRFVILERKESKPFLWYQSADTDDLAFVIANPYLIKADYQVDVKAGKKGMGWKDVADDELKLYVIINASSGEPAKMTANLMGPLLINTAQREAVQMVIHNSPYSHRYPIFKALTR
jgi:flagellar assembly factor FliW